MSEHDLPEPLARAWRSLSDPAAVAVPAALRRRGRQRAVLALEMLGCGLVLAAALYFWLAGDGLVFRVSASVLALIAVSGIVLALRTRAGLGRWSDWTPEGVLAFRLRECEVALFNARYGFVALAGLVAFAVFVWLAAELGWDALPPRFHYLYAGCVAVTVLLTATWALWRLRSKQRERLRLRALIEELRDA